MAEDRDNTPIDKDRQYAIWQRQAEISAGLLRKISASPPSPHEHVVRCLNAIQKRAMNALNSLIVLNETAPHDHHHDGAVILRALYDVHLQGLYLLEEPEKRSRLYTDFLAVQVYGLLRMADRNQTDIGEAIRSSLLRPYFVQNVMTNYVAIRRQFLTRKGDACRTNWYRGTLADLAGVVGYLSEYELLQRNLSNSVHSTPLGLLQGAGVNDSILMNHAWVFNFRILGGMARYIGIQLDEFEDMAVRISRRNLNDYPPPTLK